MGNCDVEKEDSDVVEWAIHTLSESNDEDKVNHATQVLVNHGYVTLDADTIVLNTDKDVEPCKDAISRKAAIDAFERFIHELGIEDEPYNYGEMALSVKNVPSVTPKQRTGHWIRWYEQKETEWGIENTPHCKCSECGKEYDPHSSQFIKFCSECGAKMVEPQESEG